MLGPPTSAPRSRQAPPNSLPPAPPLLTSHFMIPLMAMEEGIGAEPVPLRASPASASNVATKPAAVLAEPRQMFSVELRPGETTIVSWKKLIKDAGKGDAPSSASAAASSETNPALESWIARASAANEPAECDLKGAPQSTGRSSSVIERIEHLYMGRESGDEEELADVLNDDQYDTENSFIDDTELNDYFEVDKSSTKDNGLFVDRGELERDEPSLASDTEPKKRRRKESVKPLSDKNEGHAQVDLVSTGNVKMKAAARNAPLVEKKSFDQFNPPVDSGEHYQEGKRLKTKSSSSTLIEQNNPYSAISLELVPAMKLPKRDTAIPTNAKDSEKQKSAVIQSRNLVNKLKGRREVSDAMKEISRDKNISCQYENQSKRTRKDEYYLETSKKMRYREKNGNFKLPDLNSPGSMKTMQTPDGSGAWIPESTALQRAIHDLEKTDTEFRPLKDVQKGDSQGVKKRLPSEIKQKLAKVARLARYLTKLVGMGLKADKIEEIKKEVNELIKLRVAVSKSKISMLEEAAEKKAGLPDDFRDPSTSGRILKASCGMDNVIEDKICNIYDLYVEVMNEGEGPPNQRKFCIELAKLWPVGCMDKLDINDVLLRAKRRKKALYKQYQDEERRKRRKLSFALKTEQTLRLSGHVQGGQDRQEFDLNLSPNGTNYHHLSKHEKKRSVSGKEGIVLDLAATQTTKSKSNAESAMMPIDPSHSPHPDGDNSHQNQHSSNIGEAPLLQLL